MEIQILEDVKLIKYHAFGISEEGGCKSIMALSQIPGFQIRGRSSHYLRGYTESFVINFCRTDFYLYNQYLDSSEINVELFHLIGKFFELELFENDVNTLSYKTKDSSGGHFTPYFAYCFDKDSDTKFFFLYTYNDGQERTPELDTIYFRRICKVKMNHEGFIKLYGLSPNGFRI